MALLIQVQEFYRANFAPDTFRNPTFNTTGRGRFFFRLSFWVQKYDGLKSYPGGRLVGVGYRWMDVFFQVKTLQYSSVICSTAGGTRSCGKVLPQGEPPKSPATNGRVKYCKSIYFGVSYYPSYPNPVLFSGLGSIGSRMTLTIGSGPTQYYEELADKRCLHLDEIVPDPCAIYDRAP